MSLKGEPINPKPDPCFPKDDQPDVYKQIIDVIAHPNAIAMVGAGISCSQGYPDWQKLLGLLSTEATRIDPSKEKLLQSLVKKDGLKCADKIKQILGSEVFYSELVKNFGPDKPQYNELHEKLIGLPFRHFLTTNYDRILQAAHEGCLGGEKYVEHPLESHKEHGNLFDLMFSEGTPKRYVHVHGSIRFPQSMLLAYEDYEERYTRNPGFVEILKQLFTRRLVFFGFSLNDDDFMRPLKHLTTLLGTSAEPRHFAILPKEKTSADEAAVREICRTRYCIEPLFYNPVNNHEELLCLLKNLNDDVKSRQKELLSEKLEKLVQCVSREEPAYDKALEALAIIAPTSSRFGSQTIADATLTSDNDETKLDIKITDIFVHVTTGFPEVAIQMYKSILSSDEDGLIPRLKYRLHANIANALNSMNRQEDAADEYIIATDFWVETKEAQALRSLGLILKGKCVLALSALEALCDEHPGFARGHALRLRAMPKGTDFRVARKTVPVELRKDPEVAYTLGILAYEQKFTRRAEVYSRIAWNTSSGWTEAGLSYAAAILEHEKTTAEICGGWKTVPKNVGRIRKAETLLSDLLAKLRVADPGNKKAKAYYIRSTARRLLGELPGSRRDIEEAYHHDADDLNILVTYALQREHDISLDESIEVLDRHSQALDNFLSAFILSDMLHRRSSECDADRAFSIIKPWCTKLDEINPEPYRYDVLRLATSILQTLGRSDEAESLVERCPDTVVSPSYKQLLSLCSRIHSKTIERDEAKDLCDALSTSLDHRSDYFFVREIALCADMIQHYSLSFKLWKRITSHLELSSDTRHLLRAAKYAKEHEFIIDYCTELRSINHNERTCYVCEIEANVECHEFSEALDLMSKWLQLHAEDKEMRLNLSLLAYDLGREEHVYQDPSQLPQLSDIPNAEYGSRVVQALVQSDQVNEAVILAYALWRKYSNDEAARRTLLSVSLQHEHSQILAAKPDSVDDNSTVVIKAADGDQTRIHTIEDGADPLIDRNEYPPSHEVSRLILGKKVGCRFLLGHREWIISAINNKHSYAVRNVLHKYPLDYPNNDFMQEFRVKESFDSDEDFQESLADVKTFMQHGDNRQQSIAELYQKGVLPVVEAAKLLGKSVLETMMYFAGSTKHRVCVCKDTVNEFELALQNLTDGSKLVLDETAIATVFLLDLHKYLCQLPFELIVSESILHQLRIVIRQAVERKRSSLFLGYADGKVVVNEVSPREHANWINSLEMLFDSLNTSCAIEGGKAIFEL